MFVAAAATAATCLLGVGGTTEHLPDCLSDAVTVDAEDPEQLCGLPAAGHLGDGQALHGEAGLVHDSRTHRLTYPT